MIAEKQTAMCGIPSSSRLARSVCRMLMIVKRLGLASAVMPVKAASYDVQSRDLGIDSIGHVAAWLQYPKGSRRPSTTCPAQHMALTPSCPSCGKVMVRVHIPDPAHRGGCVANACRALSQTMRARETGGSYASTQSSVLEGNQAVACENFRILYV